MSKTSMIPFLLLLGMATTAHAGGTVSRDTDKCSQEMALKADEVVSLARKSWDDFYTVFKSYAVCDDADLGEGISDSAAQLFAKHWDEISRFFELAAKDGEFESFAIGHLDETDSMYDLDEAAANAKDRCPPGKEKICKAIWAQATYPDVGGWLSLYASKQKADDGGSVGYYPEYNSYTTGDLSGGNDGALVVAFTLEGIRGGTDWLRYVAVFLKSPDPKSQEHDFCCMYQVGGKGIANANRVEVKNQKIVITGKAFVEGKDAYCCPSKPMTLSLKLMNQKLVKAD